jgi:HK97 family phage major capsid protein
MATDESIRQTVDALLREVADTKRAIQDGDSSKRSQLTEAAAKLDRVVADVNARYAQLESAINIVSKKLNRPGVGAADVGALSLRESARGLLELKHYARTPKAAPDEQPFCPSEAELEEAEHAVRGLRHLFKCTTIDQLPLIERKALTSFNMGASGFVLVPEMSARILSCLTDITDVAGMVGNITISAGSIKFMLDNVQIENAGWACDSSCYANNPPGSLVDGLGELEIKAESLRYVVCASRDILEDAAVDVETWMYRKVALAFRNTVSDAIISGDGIGKPLGLLNPAAGIPICDTGAGTPAGQISWQDLVSVKYQVPMQYHAGAVYLMNQRTFGQILTMSDALGRPIMIQSPVDPGQFLINGSPIRITTQMPDIVPGATPVLFGNLQAAYLLVYRKQTTMLQDPYSLGYCIVFRFESRVGGSTVCQNACRLLRIK